MAADPIDKTISEFLKETFAAIPVLFPEDSRTRVMLQSRIPDMHDYTKKMWLALGARSGVDYVALTLQAGNAFLVSKPLAVLECQNKAMLAEKMLAGVLESLGVTLTEDERQGREMLQLLSDTLTNRINTHLGKLS
jgi:hypothetical protein